LYSQLLRRPRQVDHEFEASPGKKVTRPCLKNKIKAKGLGAQLKW
jgi:hypothetical protein